MLAQNTTVRPPALRIRWRIFAFLFGIGFLAYVQQKSITVAAEQIMPDLHLSQLQIGWLEQAFVLGYASFQLPGGLLGQRLGARRTLVWVGLLAFLAVIATPIAPAVLSGEPLFAALLAAQLVLGISQAAIFPVTGGVLADWFPPRSWALTQGFSSAGLQLGAALTPPLIASLMLSMGWQRALLWSALPALALIASWAWYARNTPREHPSMTARELEEIGPRAAPEGGDTISLAGVLRIVRDRNALLLFVSYTCMNYVFYLLSNWVFLYLVQERHFSVLESGWLATAPPLAAALGAGLGGWIAGGLCGRFGILWGYRLVPLITMPVAGALLLVAIHLANPYAAVAALAACYFAVELNEGSFWGTAMSVGSRDTMAVGGFMNTGGNLGGIIGIPIVAYLSGRHAWNSAFFVGVGFALASAACWLGIDARRTIDTAAGTSDGAV